MPAIMATRHASTLVIGNPTSLISAARVDRAADPALPLPLPLPIPDEDDSDEAYCDSAVCNSHSVPIHPASQKHRKKKHTPRSLHSPTTPPPPTDAPHRSERESGVSNAAEREGVK
jgi:hypothetical protein